MTMTDNAMLAAIAADLDDDVRRLAYADWLDENGDPDRAELIRVQCGVIPKSVHTDKREPGALSYRELKLITAHPEWTQWPCPECNGSGLNVYRHLQHYGNCLSCGGSGDLFKEYGSTTDIVDRDITWDRGWPGWVHVERVDEVVNLNQWGHEQNYRQCTPTPLLSALATTPPWGVPLRGVIVEELQPTKGVHGWWWTRLTSGASSPPMPMFDLLKDSGLIYTWYPYPTEQAAIRAAAAAFLEFGRRKRHD